MDVMTDVLIADTHHVAAVLQMCADEAEAKRNKHETQRDFS